MRAVVDTSGWVSAMLSRRGSGLSLINAFETAQFDLVTSEPAHEETEEVLKRPALVRTGEARVRAVSLLVAIRERGEFVSIPGDLKVCRDPNDDVVIETAIRGKVDALVTLDKDLLEDANVLAVLAAAGVRVLMPGQFLAELRGAAGDDDEAAP